MNIVVVGPPGAGKGTQISLIARHFNIEHVSIGDIFRAAQMLNSPLGSHVSSSVLSGDLVDDKTVNSLVSERILELPKFTGFALDGFPRSAAQVSFLCNFLHEKNIQLDGVFELDIIDSLAEERLRKQAISTGKSIVSRTDDADIAIKNRIKNYRSEIDEIRHNLSKIAPIFYIDASLSIQSVSEQIFLIVNKLKERH